MAKLIVQRLNEKSDLQLLLTGDVIEIENGKKVCYLGKRDGSQEMIFISFEAQSIRGQYVNPEMVTFNGKGGLNLNSNNIAHMGRIFKEYPRYAGILEKAGLL